MLSFFLLLCLGEVRFVEEKSIVLDIGDYFFHDLGHLAVDGDRIYATPSSKPGIPKSVLMVWNHRGEQIKVLDDPGQGPGNLNSARSLSIHGDQVIVAEFSKPLLHIYNRDLEHVADKKTKVRGKVIYHDANYIGVWGTHFHNGDRYLVALYDQKDFSEPRYLFPLKDKEINPMVASWGDATKLEPGKLIGSAVHPYQLVTYDLSGKRVDAYPLRPPAHNPPFTPFKESPNGEASFEELDAWSASWAIIDAVHTSDDMVLMALRLGKEKYLDIWSKDGKLLKAKYKMDTLPILIQKNWSWRVVKEETEEEDSFTLIQEAIVRN